MRVFPTCGMSDNQVGESRKMGEITTGVTNPVPAGSAAIEVTGPKFGKIRLDIWNSVLPLDKLSQTPSQKDGLSADLEFQIRSLGCDHIQVAGKLLGLPQVGYLLICEISQ